MKTRIVNVVSSVDEQKLKNTWEELLRRLRWLRFKKGAHLVIYLKKLVSYIFITVFNEILIYFTYHCMLHKKLDSFWNVLTYHAVTYALHLFLYEFS